LWNFGDGNTNSTTNYPLHTYAVPSTAYNVSLTVFNACGDSDTYTSSLQAALQLGGVEWTMMDLEIYPNPAQGFITLESDFAVEGQITLVDAMGRTVLQTTANGLAQHTLDVSDLAGGMYVLRIVNEGQFYQDRIQIVK
jgi:PKD repeat protein